MPERIQMSRQRPWRAEHPDAMIVSRPSKYGNPIRVIRERIEGQLWWRVSGSPLDRNGGPAYVDPETARYFAAQNFKWDLLNGRYGDNYPSIEQIQRELAGRDVACWCSIRTHRNGMYEWGYCHGDVLIEVANGAYA